MPPFRKAHTEKSYPNQPYFLRSKVNLSQRREIFNLLSPFVQTDKKKKIIYEFTGEHTIEFVQGTSCSQFIFFNRIAAALELLKQEAYPFYMLFCLYNKTIRSSKESCANFNYGTIEIAPPTLGEGDHASKIWLASALIHETIHYWQFETAKYDFYKYPFKDSQACELEAIKYQIQVLELLNAPNYMIEGLKRERGTHPGRTNYLKPW